MHSWVDFTQKCVACRQLLSGNLTWSLYIYIYTVLLNCIVKKGVLQFIVQHMLAVCFNFFFFFFYLTFLMLQLNLFCTFDFLQWHMCWNLCCWIWSLPVLSFSKLVTCSTTSPLIWCALPCTSSHQEWLAFDTNIGFGRRYFLIEYILSCTSSHQDRLASDTNILFCQVIFSD